MDELFSLKWNNHCSAFLQVLSNIRDKEKYSDVTLACAGKFYNVHKLILSSCSDYFKDIFDLSDSKNLVILLKDIKTEELETILDYMYMGKVNVRQKDLAPLIKVAECLQIKGLAVPDEEPAEKSSKPKRNATSPKSSRKRKLDEHYSPSTSPPAKIKVNETSNGEEDNSAMLEEMSGDCENVETIIIKEEEDNSSEDNVLPAEENENVPESIDVKYHDIDTSSDPLNCELEESTLGTDVIHELDKETFPDGSYNADDQTEWPINSSSIDLPPPDYAYNSTAEASDTDTNPSSSFQCHVCYAVLNNNTQLENHIRMHPGAKLHSCNLCDYTSNKRGNLSLHKKVHSGNKPFLCTLCPYKCLRKFHLKRHMLIHSGERPYSCNLCPYAAKLKNSLKRHMCRLHGVLC